MEFRLKLSERMQAIADRVEPGERVADIGTDHGQIPVWLFSRGITPRAILSDISAESIRKAEMTAGAYQFGDGLSFRVGDGLKVLEPGEADAVIIAGMGGKLIRDILDADIAHTLTFRKLILQPRKGMGPLRKWLLEKGYSIIREDVVLEGRFYPEIITATRPEHEGEPAAERPGDLAEGYREHLVGLDEQDIHLRVPPWMVNASGRVRDYLNMRIWQEETKLESMRKAKERDPEAEDKVLADIAYLNGLKGDMKIDEI